jgi:hypothetical protein
MNRQFTSIVASVGLLLSCLVVGCDSQSPRNEAKPDKLIVPVTEIRAVTEIALERTGCYGTCPVYKLAIKDDGSFRYHGGAYVERLGDHTGKITREQFTMLAKFAVESRFMTLNADYTAEVTDMETVITTVVMDGQKKTVQDYAGAGPERLQKFQTMIAESLKNAKWD